MTIEARRYEGQGVTQIVMTACPFCGYEFSKNEHRWRHFLNDHTVDDVPALRSGGGR
ncbi:hypothetical protein ACFQH6_19560 [Halobacteriaceae archaeon GCM10025711]